MYFSPSTIAAVAGLLATASAAPSGGEHVSSHALAERDFLSSFLGGGSFGVTATQTALCNKPNFGAVGKPWEHGSTPGSFCGNKPKNTGAWKNIPTWDGGDKVKCSSYFSAWGLKICASGNKVSPLPKGCRPPKAGKWWPKTPVTAPTVSSAAPVVPSAVSSAAGAASSVASSAAGAASSAPAASSAAAASSAPASSAAAPSPSASAGPTDPTDPYADPVCSGKYQETFANYTLTAPNGYWMGKTVGGAIQDASYMTYTLTTDPTTCLAACDQIEGCVFVNSYIDRNDDEAYLPKHTPGVYTCAFFSSCVGTEKADNFGGQDDPNDILESNGWCKSGACGQ